MEKSKPGIDNALKYFSTHPFEYLVILGRNILYFWDKTNLFYYEDPFYPQDKYVIRTINIIFLFLSMIGIAAFIRLKKRMEKENLILIATLSLIFYLTIPMSFLVPEDRLTLPADIIVVSSVRNESVNHTYQKNYKIVSVLLRLYP
jgi:Na+/melibiose symporter-like transporter